MDPQLKQRLVGIGVIFSLAVIFLPMILDGSGQRRQDVDIEIPPRPQIKSEVDVERRVLEIRKEVAALPELQPLIVDEQTPPEPAKPPAATKRVERDSELVAQASSEPRSIAKTPPASSQPALPDAAPKPAKSAASEPQVGGDSWVIQVGSFSERERAFKQRDRLRKTKLAAVFIEQFEREPGKTSYRVRMGPFIDRESAKVVRNKVMAKYDIRGLVMKYEK
jgi:DedD protein